MSTFEAIAGLPLHVDGYRLEGRRQVVSSAFERHVTLILLEGGGHVGIGEDVTYESGDQRRFQQGGDRHDLAGEYSLASFSRKLDEVDWFPVEPESAASRHYRRWALESAAADLALRQAGRSLAEQLGLAPRPLHFVVSLRLGDPPTLDPLQRLLDACPATRFKLDPVSAWDDRLIAGLVDTGAVVSVDFKGAYRGTPVDQRADADLYRRVAEAFPEAWIEDPELTDATRKALAGHERRITWDAPIHSVADIDALPFEPRMLNVKPSRFGTWAVLCETYDTCRERGIGMYGGGQFELGPGRGQIQALAALFHPDGPNDTAPRGYNEPHPPAGLPASPLSPALEPTGFRWSEEP